MAAGCVQEHDRATGMRARALDQPNNSGMACGLLACNYLHFVSARRDTSSRGEASPLYEQVTDCRISLHRRDNKLTEPQVVRNTQSGSAVIGNEQVRGVCGMFIPGRRDPTSPSPVSLRPTGSMTRSTGSTVELHTGTVPAGSVEIVPGDRRVGERRLIVRSTEKLTVGSPATCLDSLASSLPEGENCHSRRTSPLPRRYSLDSLAGSERSFCRTPDGATRTMGGLRGILLRHTFSLEASPVGSLEFQ